MAQRLAIVGGPDTARGDHKIVLLDHTTGSFDAEFVQKQSVVGRRVALVTSHISASSSGMTSTRFLDHNCQYMLFKT